MKRQFAKSGFGKRRGRRLWPAEVLEAEQPDCKQQTNQCKTTRQQHQ